MIRLASLFEQWLLTRVFNDRKSRSPVVYCHLKGHLLPSVESASKFSWYRHVCECSSFPCLRTWGIIFEKDVAVYSCSYLFFCRYCPVVCHCPFFRPMHQCAHFLACLLMTPVPDTYSLYLYCYPSLKQPEVEKKLSSYVIPYKGEGKSKKPTCFGDKIEVSLSAFHFVQGSQRNERIALK